VTEAAPAPIGVIAHYNLLERLELSGPGDLFRARDTKLGRTVAVRLLPEDFTVDRQKLIAGARGLSALSHPNVTALFDVGEHDNRVYLAFEFQKGQSLRAESAGRPMNVRRAVEIAIQIADAVSDAHAHGFGHGGLSPDSVVISAKGRAKIPAFELASQSGFDRNGNDVVILQNFDRPFRAPLALRNEQDRVTALAGLSYLRDPIVDPAAEFQGRLTTHMAHTAGIGDWGSGIQSRFIDCELFEMAAGDEPRLEICPCHIGLRRRQRCDVTAGHRVGKTGFELVANLLRLFPDLLFLRDHKPQATRRREELEQRNRILLFVKPLAHGHDEQLIGCAGRTLCRWIEAPQRFDHVPHELDAHRFGVTRREYVDNAATNRKRAVLLDRILSRKARINEKVRKVLWIDLCAGSNL